jgi:poly-beta-1,6-N-acetyl-D-glucosamine synthase
MNYLHYLILILLLPYAGLLCWMAIGFVRTRFFEANHSLHFIPLTIIIAARNEEKTIGRCLRTILLQKYDLKQIQLILINDAGTDSTVLQAQTILKTAGVNHKIISNPLKLGKKKSIALAVQHAVHEVIVQRDADTYTDSDLWLKSISDFYSETKADMIIGPVAIADNAGLLWALQAIENNVLSVLSAGTAFFNKAFLCSGANLIYTKTIFEKTDGHQTHLLQPSGDDVLFMEEIKKIPSTKIQYLKSKSAIVRTYPCFTFKNLLLQKIRWASKFTFNSNKLNYVLAIITFLINLSWIYCLSYAFITSINTYLCSLFVFLKLLIDILLLFLASSFIKNKGLAWYTLPVGLIYPIYACIVAMASVFIKPKWK